MNASAEARCSASSVRTGSLGNAPRARLATRSVMSSMCHDAAASSSRCSSGKLLGFFEPLHRAGASQGTSALNDRQHRRHDLLGFVELVKNGLLA